MENSNTNTEYKPSYDTIKQKRDHFEERLKIEREKREALENKISSFMKTKPNILGRIIGNDGEADLDPLGEFHYKFLQLFVYEYGMAALRISGKPDTVKFARFD